MTRRYHNALRKAALLTVATALASAAVLWSWNTLAPLFGGPTLQFRHAVAFLIVLVVLRVALGHSVGRRRREALPEVPS